MVEEVQGNSRPDDGIGIALLKDQKYTVEEYKEALAKPHGFPSTSDTLDVIYYTKHAHNLPPAGAYFVLTKKWDKVCTEDNPNDRLVFYGWDNITEFEEKQIQLMHDECKGLGYPIPETFDKRDVLKFA